MPERHKVVIMKEDDWINFRWELALDVISVIQKENFETGQAAVIKLRDMDAKVQKEWREADGSVPK